MTLILERLNQIMENQLSLYGDLLQLCKKEQDLLVKNQGDELESLLLQQDVVIRMIEQNEKIRRNYFYDIAFEFGIEYEELSFQKIIGLAPTPYSVWFEQKHNRLAELIDQLNSVNQLNTSLISNTINYTDYMMKLISRATVAPSYNSEGEQAIEDKKLLDTKT